MNSQREAFEHLAGQVRQELARLEPLGVETVWDDEVAKWPHEGWSVEVGELRGRELRLHLWWDRYLGGEELELSCWLHSPRKQPLKALVKSLPPEWGTLEEILERHRDPESWWVTTALSQRNNALRGAPVLDCWDSQFYLGRCVGASDADGLLSHLSVVLETFSALLVPCVAPCVPPRKLFALAVVRPEQADFRRQLLEYFEGRCVVSGCEVEETLEAAHIEAFSEDGGESIANGLLLRADLHKLFDRNKLRLRVREANVEVEMDDDVLDGYPGYAGLYGQVLSAPFTDGQLRALEAREAKEAPVEGYMRNAGRD